MSNNVSSNYGALFGNRVVPNNAAAANANAVPAAPVQPADMARISATPNDLANAASVTASPDMRGELLALRKELMDIDKQLMEMMRQLDTQAAGPAPADLGDDVPMIPSPGPATATPGTAEAGGSYSVKPGDYLWKIARDQLGDANRWTEIYALNKDAIGDNPNLLQPGQVLKMPGAKPAIKPQPQPQPANNVPAWPPAQPNNAQPNNPLPNNQWPPAQPNNQIPAVPNPLPPIPQAPPPGVGNNVGLADVSPTRTNRNLSDQDAFQVGREFGLMQPNAQVTPDAKANIAAFMDELDSYQGEFRGKVFGPGMEALAANAGEAQQIRQSVQQIQQALTLLIKSGQLKPHLGNGQPVTDLPLSGSYFKTDANGQDLRDAQGQPMTDEAFVAAITQFKQDHGLHQSYRLADGSFGINEYVGPNTVEVLKQELLKLQGVPRQ
ncbi:MAG: LysM peptidoglycan-binding protein [Cyanobacteria bacterium RYN_339]|nr:LysM peptidoglycan-binding protein [Cyanobacteria bacterium RYN_339]